jgi:hypothetical protein
MTEEEILDQWLLALRDFLLQADKRESAPFADIGWLLSRINGTLDDGVHVYLLSDRIKSADDLECSLENLNESFPDFLPKELASRQTYQSHIEQSHVPTGSGPHDPPR